MSEKIFQVSEFNELIKTYLNQVGDVVIEGEISECTISQDQWIHITIKDKSSSVKIFAITHQISGYSLLEQGMLVHVYGKPSLYLKTGQFSVYATQIVPAGEGALKVAFEKLKEKLDKEGLFNQQRKRQVVMFPERIGLITAKDSRAYGDFVKVLTHRIGGVKIFFYPVNVQGKDSVESIIRAFNYFNNKRLELDAVVLIRGGGSLEDLQSFNDERVVRAIFSSKAPVVCGVGHEADTTIASLVSDIRASTPSNAAELLVRNKTDVLIGITRDVRTMYSQLLGILSDNNQKIVRNVQSLKNSIERQTSVVHVLIAKFNSQFVLLDQELNNLKRNRDDLQERVYRGIDYWIRHQETKVINLVRLLNSFDMQKILKRGFSMTFDKNGKILKTVNQLNNGVQITTDLFDGRIDSQVLGITKK